MKYEALSSVCSLALLIGGCPQRQGVTRIIYVPASTSAPAPAVPSQTLVIEEPAPAPPPAEAAPPQQTPAPKPPARHRRVLRTELPADANTEEEKVESPEEPAAEVPALGHHESSAEESNLRGQIQDLQKDFQARQQRLDHAALSPTDLRTLEDARNFFAQSERALEKGDMQRALNLARKASLLAAALEQPH